MAEIKIVSVNKDASQENADANFSRISFNLSAPPSDEWERNFKEVKAKNPKLNNLRCAIEGQKLEVFYPSTYKPQAVLDDLKNVVAATNQEEMDFQTNLDQLKFD